MACGKGFIESIKEYKGAKPSVWFEGFFREVKYAWQRAWRGYDDSEVWDIEGTFMVRTEKVLRAFRDRDGYGCFPRLDGTNDYMSEAETCAVLTEMIQAFRCADDDVCYEEMYGISPFVDPLMNTSNKEGWRRANECAKETERNRVRAIEMFVKWLPYLWS